MSSLDIFIKENLNIDFLRERAGFILTGEILLYVLEGLYLCFYLHDKKGFFLTRRLIHSDSPIRIFTDIHSGPEFHFWKWGEFLS